MSGLFGNPGGGSNPAASSSGAVPSLFGAAPAGGATTSAGQTGGLFGAPAAGTSQPQGLGGGLFGNTTASAAPAPGGSFGLNRSSTMPTQPASIGGLFGNTGGASGATVNTAASGSLFGTAPASTAQSMTTSAGGLFGGGLGGGTATTSSGLGGGPFSTSTATGRPGGLFGNAGAPTAAPQPMATATQPTLGGSVFGSAPAANQAAQPVAGNTPTAYFESLLERGRKRNNQEKTNGLGSFADLPSLQLNLGDIARKARNLGSGGPTAAEAKAGDGSRAHYLLAASGVSTVNAMRDLNSFSTQAGASAGSAYAQDADIDGYISNLHAQSTLDLINEGLEQSRRDFDAFLEENVQMEWDAQRKRIYEHFGLSRPGQDDLHASAAGAKGNAVTAAFGRSSRRGREGLAASTTAAGRMSFGTSMGRSIIGAAASKNLGRSSVFNDINEAAQGNSLGAVPEGRLFRDKQEKFAEKVKFLNETRLREEVYPVLHQFAEVEGQVGIDTSSNLVDAYKALVEITGENKDIISQTAPNAVKERHYREAYLDDAPNSERTIALRKRTIEGSRKFLEKRFLTESVDSMIAKNAREASLGGVPSAINKIRAYVRVLAARKELGDKTDTFKKVGDDYAWVIVYYLVRSGLVQDAVKYIGDNDKAFKNLDPLFVIAIQEYAKNADRRLPRDVQGKLNTKFGNFKNAAEGTIDPYHFACMKIVGRCELNKRTLDGVRMDMDDWIWLHFSLAREASRVDEAANEVFNLQNLRTTVADIGKRHFSQGSESGSSFGSFFYLQILAGMFEDAVAYLYQHNPVAAVHFAIGLAYYGLLRVSDYSNSGNLKSYTTTGKSQIAFGPLIGYYTRDFRAAKAEAAADYLILLNLNADLPGEAGRQQSEMCHEGLRELVLETREFAQLLGDIRSDGHRIKGAIEQRLRLIGLKDQQAFLKTVTIQAAKIADDSGRTTDAVLLYHLAEEYNNVITILNRTLSESLSLSLGSGGMRIEPLKPRSTDNAGAPTNSSLSLTSVDDPVQLAKNMVTVYQSNALLQRKISQANQETCGVLLSMCAARHFVETGKFKDALDTISSLSLLPTDAEGNITKIRQCAQNFNGLPPVIARNVGNLLLWTITCCSRLKEEVMGSNFYGSDAMRQDIARRLVQQARDLMMFAGLVKFRLPAEVMEVLAREGSDVGGI